MQGVNWLNEVALIDKPKPPVPSARSVLERLFRETAKDKGKVVRVPKARMSSIQSAYLWAREAGFVMSMETNGQHLYLRWDKKSGK